MLDPCKPPPVCKRCGRDKTPCSDGNGVRRWYCSPCKSEGQRKYRTAKSVAVVHPCHRCGHPKHHVRGKDRWQWVCEPCTAAKLARHQEARARFEARQRYRPPCDLPPANRPPPMNRRLGVAQLLCKKCGRARTFVSHQRYDEKGNPTWIDKRWRCDFCRGSARSPGTPPPEPAKPKGPWEPCWATGWHSGLAIPCEVIVKAVQDARRAWKHRWEFEHEKGAGV